MKNVSDERNPRSAPSVEKLVWGGEPVNYAEIRSGIVPTFVPRLKPHSEFIGDFMDTGGEERRGEERNRNPRN